MSAPYKLEGMNVAFRQGRSDARAGRPAKSTRDMSTFYAAAYLRGYKGQDYRRGADGHLKFFQDGIGVNGNRRYTLGVTYHRNDSRRRTLAASR